MTSSIVEAHRLASIFMTSRGHIYIKSPQLISNTPAHTGSAHHTGTTFSKRLSRRALQPELVELSYDRAELLRLLDERNAEEDSEGEAEGANGPEEAGLMPSVGV